MKAISLWEPWASLIALGAKTYETRHWPWKYRGELLICAAKGGLSKIELLDLLNFKPFRNVLGENPKLNFGNAVAIVNVTDCIPTEKMEFDSIKPVYEQDFGDYTYGRFAIRLENIRRIKNPFPVKGAQGFFNVELPTFEFIKVT